MTHKEELSLENIQKRKELDKNSLQTTGDTKNILDNHYKQEKRPSLGETIKKSNITSILGYFMTSFGWIFIMQFFIEDNTAKVMLIVGISLYTIILIFGIKNLIETRNKIIADRDYNQTKEYGVFLIVLSSIFLLMYVYMPIHLAINRDYYYPTTYQSRSRKSTNLQGCCSYHGGVSYCGAGGAVICNDGQKSTSCSC